MKTDVHRIYGYKGEVPVDNNHQVIVAGDVSNQSPDVDSWS